MELLKSGIKSVLGGPQDAHQPSGAETVEKLVDRVLTSTLLEDRRDACRALKALSKKFRVEVGAQGMNAFLQVLEYDRSDNEIIGYVLEAICNVISGVQEDDDVDIVDRSVDENLGFQFTEIFIKKNENVALLLELMEEYDFKVRWPVVKLLTSLLFHKPKELQDCILVSPMGVSRLMDLLSDTREIIRNDTLLLLAHLTKGNANIQKIVAFENAFDKLLSIIRGEEYSDGGVIVEDCLLVLQTLLRNNSSNQTFFREGSYIQHLAPFFQVQASAERGWSPQKVTNIHMMLQVLRVLVSPNNPQQVTLSAQKAMFQCGLLEQLCGILMAMGIPADILTETINTVAEMLRGNHNNQEYFSNINAPSEPPRPAIVILLMSMVNEKQPFSLRCSVLYCFQCFLYKNEHIQSQIVMTLLPSTTNSLDFTAGQLLCGGLFSGDTISNWLAAVALSHSLVDSSMQKEQLLRVQLATGPDNPPVSLIMQLSLMLQSAEKPQTRLGLLMLMCTWLAHCPHAVSQFLAITTNVPFLTSQVGLSEHNEGEELVQGICAFLLGICIEFNESSQAQDEEPKTSKEDLCQLVIKRIGLELFLAKLNSVSKNEYYSRASQNPHLRFRQQNEVLFDYEFCRLFKSLEGVVLKAVQPKLDVTNGPEVAMTPTQQEHLRQYKDLIREQDMKIQTLSSKLSEVTAENASMKVELSDTSGTVQQLRDQIALFKAQKSVSSNSLDSQLKDETEKSRSQLALQEKEIEEKQQMKQQLDQQIQDLSTRLSELTVEFEAANTRVNAIPSPESHQDATISSFQGDSNPCMELELTKQELAAKQQQLNEATELVNKLKEKCASLPNSNQSDSVSGEATDFEETIKDLKAEIEQLRKSEADYKVLQDQYQAITKEKDDMEVSFNLLKKEQEDMLILLTEQGDKILQYKDRLKELGEPIEDDDDYEGDGYDDLDVDNEEESLPRGDQCA